MTRFIGSIRPLAGLVATLLVAAAATASPLNVDTGKTLVVAPGSSAILTLSLTNENASSVIDNFNGWSTGLQLLPQLGSTGTASITLAALPATNPALTDPEGPPTLLPNQTLSVAANGTTSYSLLASANQSAAVTTFSLGQQFNVADLTIALSGNASGSWNLFAVNNGNGIASWASESGVATNFGNLARVNGDGGTLLIGTVSAVPEPGSLMLAGSAVLVAGWYSWRSRRHPTVVEA